MTARYFRDVGKILLTISSVFVGGLLCALAIGVPPSDVQPWGWALALVAVPISYALRRHGEAEMALERNQVEVAAPERL